MRLIPTPRSLAQRGELYHQLASLTAAGIGLIAGLEMVAAGANNRSLRKPISRIVEALNQGAGFTDALRSSGTAWMSAFDLALLEAGEKSGRLDICFRLLAGYYEQRAVLARQVLADLAYPAFLLHMAILIFPVQWLTRLVWKGEVLGFVAAKAAILVPAYIAVFLLIYFSQGRRNVTWRALLERLCRAIPVLGTARLNLALARLSVALESLLNAGVSIVEAWPLAAAASGSPALVRTVDNWQPQVLGGQTPAEVLRESGAFPDLFASLYSTGEKSGQLDDALRRLHQHYQEEGIRKMHAFAQWTPRLVYLIVVLLIAYQVISFWTGYFSQINDLAS
jgi:type II secretory pathway component PulF